MAELDPDAYPDDDSSWPIDGTDDGYSPSAKTVSVVLLYLVIFVIGVAGNTLTVSVVALNPHLRTVTNLFISQMAVGDLTLLLLAMPFDVISTYVFQKWNFSGEFCSVVYFFQDYAIAVTAFTLTAMSIDRFLTLSRPMRAYSIRSAKKFVAVAFLVQLLAVSAALPKSHFSDVTKMPVLPVAANNESAGTVCRLVLSRSASLKFSLTRIAVFYVVPLIIITIAFTRINAFLKSSEAQVLLSANYKIMAACKRALKLLLTLITLFSVLFLPATIDSIVSVFVRDGFSTYNKWYSLCEFLADTFFYSISVYKPFVYSLLSVNFRRGYRNLICCLRNNPNKESIVSQSDDSSTVEASSLWSYYSGADSIDAGNVGDRL
ncbi:phe13-bombesin receptor-like [Ptychodera flava]|uniref:phe13-bombesin receptor-like n=1 Tax=Ptychodera flava TaxID=63121 RepID=UPI003969D4F1